METIIPMRKLKLLLVAFLFLGIAPKISAISFNLDSIAKWGRFAKFCVDTYYWGDRFFNTYDTTYVKGTGTKFNVKLTSQNWLDTYRLDFDPDGQMNMVSDLASNVGIHLTYLAVSVGYDMNVNKFFNGYERSRKRIEFNFSCALFSADLYVQDIDLTTSIRSFKVGDISLRPHEKFDGMRTKRWGIDAYYFFNNKKYSQAAAFNYSRVQLRSQGSWFLGISYCNQKYNFNFNTLPQDITDHLPPELYDKSFRADTYTYAVKGGFGYNWVPRKHWVVAVSESPMIGYCTGRINGYAKNSLNVSNLFRIGAIYNLNRFFTGVHCSVYTNFAQGQATTLTANIFTAEMAVGYRFNLW